MNSLSNYPPGVTGNEPEINGDDGWENVIDTMNELATKHGMTDMDMFVAIKIGVNAWYSAKSLGAKFPHDN